MQNLLWQRTHGTPSIFHQTGLWVVASALIGVYALIAWHRTTNRSRRLYRSLRETEREQHEYDLISGELDRLESHLEFRTFVIRHLRRTRVKYRRGRNFGYALLTTMDDIAQRNRVRKVQRANLQGYMDHHDRVEVDDPETSAERTRIHQSRDEESEYLAKKLPAERDFGVKGIAWDKLEVRYFNPPLRA